MFKFDSACETLILSQSLGTVLPRWRRANYPRTPCPMCKRMESFLWNPHMQQWLCQDCPKFLYRIRHRQAVMMGWKPYWSDDVIRYPWPTTPTEMELDLMRNRRCLR